jgi:hypothetical protein
VEWVLVAHQPYFFGGNEEPSVTRTAKTEVWNGSVWTEVADLNLIRYAMARGGAGIATDALCIWRRTKPTRTN